MKKQFALILALLLLLTLLTGTAQAETAATVPDLTITRRPIPENESCIPV